MLACFKCRYNNLYNFEVKIRFANIKFWERCIIFAEIHNSAKVWVSYA
jgi:hypothetical protein